MLVKNSYFLFFFDFLFLFRMSTLDFEVTSPPSDSISDLAFSPQADILAVSSWDGGVRIYQVEPTGNTVPKASYNHEGPVLCVDWAKDGSHVVSGGTDKAIRMYDLNTGQSTQIGAHDEPVKAAKFLDGQNVLATGSWDKTLKYWDFRSPQPVGTVQLNERCYAMDTRGNLLVAATADRQVLVFDLSNPTTIFKQSVSPLKWQTRTVSCFIDGKGYAIGSIEGRLGIQYIDEQDAAKSFSFKCHRDETKNVYAVNDISFHPIYGTFSTSGADGTVSYWDKDSKQRLHTLPKAGTTIPCTAFNRTGNIFAYAVSYDWTKGHQFYSTEGQINKIMLHAVKDEEIKPRAKK
ncbi:WD40-repeat-containing domain protein [Gilbertella persicaria]|uniref:WD40-repeat-containing domain protein n=1 Tax=Gilbertella persicaria TaxID=101096 RepID=UPI00221F2B56|nr:WD40-repeat-containing domain protein [Gilbertella persicaria]KAI8047976.1 WD40-repeat-containing domain protein [Gilbertella persicaria]